MKSQTFLAQNQLLVRLGPFSIRGVPTHLSAFSGSGLWPWRLQLSNFTAFLPASKEPSQERPHTARSLK